MQDNVKFQGVARTAIWRFLVNF